MTTDGEKSPEKTPPKELIQTPPRIPALPSRNPSPKNENALNADEVKPHAFDFRAAIRNAVAADGVGESLAKPKHERGVSWDQNVANNERVSPQPPRPATDVSIAGVPSLMAKTGNKPLPPRPPVMAKRGISTGSGANGLSRRTLLESIPDDPYEREAEDVLLRALEERDPMHAKANTGANILPGVPVDLIQHDFSADSDEKPKSGDIAEPSSPNPRSRPRLTSREPSMFNRTRLMSTDQSIASKGRPTTMKPTHKRQLTVEEALFGLTAALSAVQHEERRTGHLPPERRDTPGRERGDTASSTDALAKTAELVFGSRFRGRRSSGFTDSQTSGSDLDDNDGSPIPSQEAPAGNADSLPTGGPTSAKSRWGILKQNLDLYKKNDDIAEGNDDDDELEGADIEIGDDVKHMEASVCVEEQQNSTQDVEGSNENDTKKKSSKRRKRKGPAFSPFKHLPYSEKIKKEWDVFSSFMAPRKATMFTYARYILMYLWGPALAAAACLFHFFENPSSSSGNASISWWIIFICMRQVGIILLSKSVEAVVVDFLAIQTRAILRSCGPVITLLFVQSKGWPFLLSCWGILNFLLVTGASEFNKHWLFWQDVWGLFNEDNPSGGVTDALWFKRICAIASALGVAVATKRVVVGIYLGRQTFGMLKLS